MQVKLDEKDRKILNLLAENARLSYTEIGEQLGMPMKIQLKDPVMYWSVLKLLSGAY